MRHCSNRVLHRSCPGDPMSHRGHHLSTFGPRGPHRMSAGRDPMSPAQNAVPGQSDHLSRGANTMSWGDNNLLLDHAHGLSPGHHHLFGWADHLSQGTYPLPGHGHPLSGRRADRLSPGADSVLEHHRHADGMSHREYHVSAARHDLSEQHPDLVPHGAYRLSG